MKGPRWLMVVACLFPWKVAADLRDEPWLVACGHNLKNIGIALEMYSSDHQGLYPKNLRALVPVYLKKLPTCSAARRDTYSVSYKRVGKADFQYHCHGSFHRGAGLSANQPDYTSVRGLGPPEVPRRIANYKPRSILPYPPHLSCKVNLVTVAKALQAYCEQHDRFPPKLGALSPRFLKSVPLCLGQDTYSPSYQVTAQGDTYTIYCKGYNHALEGYSQDRPRFNPDRGLDE